MDYIIGIDPGVNTGFAVWSVAEKKIIHVATYPIHQAMQKVREYSQYKKVCIRIEDARLRRWFGSAGRAHLQGAGSVKRDCKIWEDYLNDLNINCEFVPPKNNRTKLTAETFRRLTQYEGRTTEHSRDAAMLVYQLT